ncbi:MAG: aminotransferase class I/II-fold pyridoxal phosphate-dependent enzyme [Clostridiales bacterium]|nr:aminotransferase class I/II-fold pyridoxal phosphate-dependent enzyme [Clostridiales bacterium]MBP3810108.1 aminotransferase class I/II-fold pyridoxal phosphate-dependent enzyme [Clostridiales bacterium]
MIDLNSKISKSVASVPPSAIRKFFDLASEMKGVISLSIGEPDFVTPWSIREAGINSLVDGYTHYSPNAGYTNAKKAIVNYINRRYGIEYEHNGECLITVGGSEGLDLAARALINPGDEVIIVEPCFVAYKATVLFAHGVPVTISTRQEDDFKLKAEDLEAAITDKTKYLIMGYPGNPTGAVMTMEDLAPIRDVLMKHPEIIVISDELYCELNYVSDELSSLARFPELKDRVVMINGFSKSYAMTGFRIGYVLGPKELIAPMTKIHQYCIMSAPSMSQFAVVEAAMNCDDQVKAMRDEYNHRRRVIIKGLNDAGLECFTPSGAFYAFPSIKNTGLTSEEFCERFLMEKKVAIVPGSAFGECGKDNVRISYAASMENIKTAMERLAEFTADLKKGK